MSAQDGHAAGISWRSSFFPTHPHPSAATEPSARSGTTSSFTRKHLPKVRFSHTSRPPMTSSHNLSRLDLERGALVFAQGGDHALEVRVAGRTESWSPCGASLGPRTAHSHCHKQYLWKRVNTKSTRRGIFWGRELAISTEIRRRSRLCRLRGATHACSRAHPFCLQVHAKPERSQPVRISCKPER